MPKVIRVESEPPTEWMRPTDLWPASLTRPVCLLNGAFDLLHLGHMRLVHQAQVRAKTVVVALDSDRKINDIKGPGRPIMCFSERAAALGYMNVHFIVEINHQQDMELLMAGLKPDFRIQGEDYLGHKSRFKIPKFFVHRPKKSLSTNQIIKRCQLIKL